MLDTQLPPQVLPEYSRLLLDVFEGDAILSIRGDEAEESWRIVEPILDEWSNTSVPLLEHQAGSDGPPRRSLSRDRLKRRPQRCHYLKGNSYAEIDRRRSW
jgi:glucose-6-phosphate 1-dehydrogenase